MANFDAELTEGEVLALLADQPEGGDVPERGRAAVAEDDLVALGQAEQGRPAVADPADGLLHRGLPVTGAHERGAGGGQRVERAGAGPWRGRRRSGRRRA